MSPTDEIEYTIKEIAVNENDGISISYSIKSFPEIYLMKHEFYYTVELLENHRQNADIIKKYEKLRDEIESRKITIENQIVDVNRKIFFKRIYTRNVVPIYYENCGFTYPYTLIGTNCENCIVVKG